MVISWRRRLSLVGAAALVAGGIAVARQQLPAESQADPDRRVTDLLARMTLEEKVAQLRGGRGRLTSGDPSAARFDPVAAAPVLEAGVGYVGRVSMRLEPADGARLVDAVQRHLRENTRLGVPALVTDEALHGFMARGATSFPQAIALASTWDPALVERVFTAAAREARARGTTWVLAPVLDVARDPRWGRTEETFGEDPYLVSRMGVAAILGLQGRGPAIDADHVLATAKHFAAHGQPEGGTNAAPANYSERILREVFLPPFEAAVRHAGARAVMASYNEIDGIPAHVNEWLLGRVLRGEWAFPGILCSDGGGILDLVNKHHVAADVADAALQAFTAGIDLELDATFGALVDHVKAGRIPMARIDEAAGRVLRAKQAVGLFDDSTVDAARAVRVTNAPEHRALALEAARRAVILLKNDNAVLPLDRAKVRTIAVIGPNAADLHVGGYSYDPAPGVSVLDGIRRKVGTAGRVLHAEGARITTGAQGWKAWWDDPVIASDPAEDTPRIAEAVAAARQADAALLVLGENEGVCREGWSRTHLGDRDSLDLPGRQAELAKAVAATGTPTIVLLINGRPLSIGEVAASVPAVLEGWYLGQETGTAVADILFGDASPGGRLPITVPRNVGQIPAYYAHKPTARQGFLFSDITPLFPFGHGLGYTTFRYDNLRVTPESIPPSGQATVSVDLTNTGSRPGDEVVQLYVHDQVASVTRPVQELRGFERVTLAPGERRTVRFTLGPADLAFLDRGMRRVVEPGVFEVRVGGSSARTTTATLRVTGD